MKLYGLIGFPLTHSFSRKYFLEKFKKEKILDVDYNNFPIENIDDLRTIVSSHKNLSGLNVTSPYKQQVIKYLDEIDQSAADIDAVNVIKIIREGESVILKGYNTDSYGFIKSLKNKITDELNSALIFGTGGAARAVANSLNKIGIKVQFVSRNIKNKETISYKSLDKEIIAKNKLLINATPLGIYPEITNKPDIPYKFISSSHILFDLIYNPPLTQFLSEGKKCGATVINGLKMLEFQAEKAWEIFNS